MRPFNAKQGGTFIIANAIAASAGSEIDAACDQIMLYNSSATALACVRVTTFPGNDLSTAVLATMTTDTPIAPGVTLRLTVGRGLKKISAIASAADGNLYVTPGNGN